jgi:hypothetical protein
MRRALITAAACLALAGCGEPAAESGTTKPDPAATPRETFTVSGFVTANGSFGLACNGIGRSADLHQGARVVVLGADGTGIATGAHAEGFADDDSPQGRCIFPFTVRKVPEGRGPFTLRVARRDAVPFAREHAGQVAVTFR